MNPALPVFEIKPIRNYFYYFLFAIILITFVSLMLVGFIQWPYLLRFGKFLSSWAALGILFAISYFQSTHSKKELKKINGIENTDALFSQYIIFCKQRLLWNGLSFFITGLLYVTTFKNTFFYILILQLALSFVFFPRKSQVLKELGDRDILIM